MRILVLDIETRPNLAHVWRLFDENIPLDRLLVEGGMLCFAAKFLGDKAVVSSSLQDGEFTMASVLWMLLEEADAVVTYNGDRFDIPHINRLFLSQGIKPPAPYKKIDLLKTVRNQFKFASNKLEFVCKELGLGGKVDNGGYDTWLGCMNNDPAAWAKMIKYNKKDVVLTEKLYRHILPWIKNHPNAGMYRELDRPRCPNCGSHHVQMRGTATTKTGHYQRYKCKSCGTWSRARTMLKENKKSLLVRFDG
jgi:hypothetical protein